VRSFRAEERVEDRIDHGAVHRRGREHSGSDEGDVADHLTVHVKVSYEFVETDADREQIEQWLEEPETSITHCAR